MGNSKKKTNSRSQALAGSHPLAIELPDFGKDGCNFCLAGWLVCTVLNVYWLAAEADRGWGFLVLV